MNSTAEAIKPDASKVTAASFIKKNIREYGMLFSLGVIMIFFQYMTEGT